MDHSGNNDNHPQRKSPRATFHDYCGGTYFVTICTADREYYFGNIKNRQITYSPLGRYCCRQIESLPQHYPYADVLNYVVMPNHVHLIVRIDPDLTLRNCEPLPSSRYLLAVVVGGLKSSITRYARRNNIAFCWQPRYHDHIIRSTFDANPITQYIDHNIERWEDDCFHNG